jgi:hypothetical protein
MNKSAIVAGENKKLKGSTWCLLDRPADSYETERTGEIRAKKTPDRRGPEQSKVK